jgi:8-amino-7-oxononanoate synthase
MTTAFDRELESRLQALRGEGLYRRLQPFGSEPSRLARMDDTTLINFASNDYLGLAGDPALKAAAQEAIARFGAGSGASRLICGSLRPHHELEETLAAFKTTPAALSFSSGYAAALGTICALLDKGDIIILDKLVHACIVDAARLSGAKMRVFAHNDLSGLESKLAWARSSHSAQARVLVVTEAVFSMDGDQAPLREIIGLKEKYGAWVMVDEAHATGIYGPNRRGLAEATGVSEQIEIQMGTLGKAIGSAGGFICGSRTLIDYLVNRARSFLFSTAPAPAAVAAATAGIHLVQSPEGAARCERLWQRVESLLQALGRDSALRSAIVPIQIGNENAAVATAAALRELGILTGAVRYPSVPRGQARLRITLSAAHTAADVTQLATALRRVWPKALETSPPQPAR